MGSIDETQLNVPLLRPPAPRLREPVPGPSKPSHIGRARRIPLHSPTSIDFGPRCLSPACLPPLRLPMRMLACSWQLSTLTLPPTQIKSFKLGLIQLMRCLFCRFTLRCHIGSKNCSKGMERYVHKRRPDGVNVINIGSTWEKCEQPV